MGSGLGGGVELTVLNLASVLAQFGHCVTVLTPAGESVDSLLFEEIGESAGRIDIVQISGELQRVAQQQNRTAPTVTSAVLVNGWRYAHRQQGDYDLLVNFAYDWLPFFLTPFLNTPVAHFVSMGSLSDAMDEAISRINADFPGTLGAYSRTQADSFASLNSAEIEWQILGSGLNLTQYEYCEKPAQVLAWAGRISPEKGLEDAIAAARTAQMPLKIFGKIEDRKYWQRLQSEISLAETARTEINWTDTSSSVEYCGFLSTAQLQLALGRCCALLMTPHWLEAFGIVAIEAMACGVPVVAYRQGGLVETVRSGKTGWLVEPGNVEELVAAIAKIDQIDRLHCRQQAEVLYSLNSWGKRFEQWFYQVISSHRLSP